MPAYLLFLSLFFPSIFCLTMHLCGMLKKLRGKRRDEQMKLESSVHVNCSVVTKSNQLLQDRKEYEISSMATKSKQPLHDGKEYEMSEEITPVSPLSSTNVEDSNVIENPDAGGGEFQDAYRGELQDRKEDEISSVVTKSNQPLQDGKEFEISSVVTKSNQPLQDGIEYNMSEEITPVSHLSPTDADVSNVVENPDAGRGALQDTCRRELQEAGGRELRDWCDLPDLVLILILKRLTSLCDFFAFSRVCKGWRFVSGIMKREYMATQPPMLCGCYSFHNFYSWKEERVYKKDQPALNRGTILGFSHGFFILLHKSDKRSFALVNPLTGVEVIANFPPFPKRLKSRCFFSHASLMSPPTSPDCMLLLSDLNLIYLCRPGDLKWAVFSRYDGRRILCEIFFKGKIYALNVRGHILIYDPSHHPKYTFLRAQNNPFSYSSNCSSTRLVDCGGELLAIRCYVYWTRPRKVEFFVHRFDFMTCEWVTLNNLGNHVLFLDSMKGAFSEDAANWGGNGNCIYYIPESMNEYKFHVFHMEDGRVEGISYPVPYCLSNCWVFPRLCC